MMDVALIGGGLCGLALAHSLQARGVAWRLFEAQSRLGGRVLTERADNGMPVDLGATWFWPGTQPAVAQLIADLGLATFPQPDDGRVLLLSDPNRAPQPVPLGPSGQPDLSALASATAGTVTLTPTPGAVHGGAQRVRGGMGQLIEALQRRLPAERLRTAHRLEAVVDHGDLIELRLRFQDARYSVTARRVVLALPPRVVAEHIAFSPALPPEVLHALRTTPTWMATAAKAGLTCATPTWQHAGLSGNAWVTHAQAMLAEVFDAGDPAHPPHGALAGFAALPASQRPSFARGRELLLDSQFAQLFGHDLLAGPQQRELFWHDWALDPETCTARDIADEDTQADLHPHAAPPELTEPLWQGRLYFGGTETARQGTGYLEGALRAAGRLRQQLTARGDAAASPPTPPPPPASRATAPG